MSTASVVAIDQRKLIEDHIPLVRSIAANFSKALPNYLVAECFEDMFQTGCLALIKCASRYDPRRHVMFCSYAKCRIKNSFVDYLRSCDFLSRDTRKLIKKVAAANDLLSKKLQREPTFEEVLEVANISQHEVAVFKHQSLIKIISTTFSFVDDEKEAHIRACTDPTKPIVETLIEAQRVDVLKMAISTLPPRYQLVLKMYYVNERTMLQISKTLHIAESRVSQLHKAAVQRLQAYFSEQPNAFKALGVELDTTLPSSLCIKQHHARANRSASGLKYSVNLW